MLEPTDPFVVRLSNVDFLGLLLLFKLFQAAGDASFKSLKAFTHRLQLIESEH